jgi:hypothetical protein
MKDEIISFAGKWMELEIIMLSKISKAQKVKHLMFSLILESRSKIIMIIISRLEDIMNSTKEGEERGS